MSLRAKIFILKDQYVADLSDGRKLEQPDLFKLAQAMYRVGIGANKIDFEWHGGTKMITAGSRVALLAEVRQLENSFGKRRVPVEADVRIHENGTPDIRSKLLCESCTHDAAQRMQTGLTT